MSLVVIGEMAQQQQLYVYIYHDDGVILDIIILYIIARLVSKDDIVVIE